MMGHKASCAIYDPCPSQCDCGAPTDYQQGFQAGAASKDAEVAAMTAYADKRNTAALDLQTQVASKDAEIAELREEADRYVWLLAHIGRLNTMALDWNPDAHPPLLVWLHQYICKEAVKEGHAWVTKQRGLLTKVRKP